MNPPKWGTWGTMGHAPQVNRPRARARVEMEPGKGAPWCPTRPTPPVPIATALAALAGRVAALSVSRHDPEAFHIAKDELAHELRQLARRIERAAA